MTATLEPPRTSGGGTDTAADDIHTWIGAATNGDQRAIDQLLRLLRPVTLRYCAGRLAQWGITTTSAEDITQEVCIAVLGSLHRYRRDEASFLSYVYGIASHKVNDARRAAARDRCTVWDEVPDRAEDLPGPEDLLLRSELREQLSALVSGLHPHQREILLHRVLAGNTAQQTAEALGSTAGAIRVAQHRAMCRLRAQLAQNPAPPSWGTP
jgi:RNA polymerase sigma-70 factor (ECF subfamily)